MHDFMELIARQPIVPFIREYGYAVRNSWFAHARRLLDYLLIYVQEGECVFHVEGTDYRFAPGQFCLIQPNELNTLQGIGHTITPFCHFDIFYNAERETSFPTRPGQTELSTFAHLLQPRLNDCAGIHVPVRFEPLQPARFKETLLKTIGLCEQGDLVSQLEAHQLLHELIMQIVKKYGSFHAPRFGRPQSLNWITSYFSLHLAEPLSLSAMAERAQLSPSRFSAVFRRQFGMPPHQYLLHLRIEHAQTLLAGTDLKLHDIADYCGFADVHHFAKTFKKITGESPGSYRNDARST